VAEVLIWAYRNGGALLAFGNGAARPMHSTSRPSSLASSTGGARRFERNPDGQYSSLTAIGNDVALIRSSRAVEALGRSATWRSASPAAATRERARGAAHAKRMGLVTVAMTGQGGGRARAESDYWSASRPATWLASRNRTS